ncbi:hypothetical protein [Pseudodesulfovibrio indicus]|uniref:hypothetical protein n=1 Tax=Pseudodesulfovibrio indicus TaxID=1716143 RepID=UPI002931BAB8|nr:hypothetical protein [Pseudodesulfovibrio indicus]
MVTKLQKLYMTLLAGAVSSEVTFSAAQTKTSQYYFYNQLGMIDEVVREDGSSLFYDYFSRNDSNPCNRDKLQYVYDKDTLIREFVSYNSFGYPTEVVEYNAYYYGYRVVTNLGYGTSGNNFGKLTSESTSVYDSSDVLVAGPFTVTYSYDSMGRRQTVQYPDDTYYA